MVEYSQERTDEIERLKARGPELAKQEIQFLTHAILGELDEQRTTAKGFVSAREARIRYHALRILEALGR